MEEDKKRIEHLIERCNQCKLNACITCDICWSEVQALENLLTRYKQLKETNERIIIEKAEALQEVRKYKAKVKDSIPKSKVKEKIEELNKLEKGFNFTGLITECETKIEVLQELLES